MEISQQEARESLGQVEQAVQRTRKMLAYGGADTLFIVWGVIWVLGFLGNHFSPIVKLGNYVGPVFAQWLWIILIAAGIVISVVVEKRRMPVKSPLGKRIGWFWGLLYVYVSLWIGLCHPFMKVQGHAQSMMLYRHFGAIAATVPMFAYVVMGLWLDHFMIWIGLAVTALTLLGLFLLPAYFWLWMAITGGGTLMGTGIFIRNRWR